MLIIYLVEGKSWDHIKVVPDLITVSVNLKIINTHCNKIHVNCDMLLSLAFYQNKLLTLTIIYTEVILI